MSSKLSQKQMVWPVSIDIPVRIGIGRYRYDNGKPCCAVGHARSQIGSDNDSDNIMKTWADSYRSIAASFGFNSCTVVSINDQTPSYMDRRILYLLAWANLGYVCGMPENVLRILDAINSGRKFKSIQAAMDWIKK